MREFKPVDWQMFSQYKEVENIARNLDRNNTFRLATYAEIALVVLSVALSNIFVSDVVQNRIWTALFVLSVTIILASGFREIYVRKKREKNKGIYKAKEFIDVFDNEICFCVLTASAYYQTLMEVTVRCDSASDQRILKNDVQGVDKKVFHFYFIEASYYLNKAVKSMAPLYNISRLVIATASEDVEKNGMISEVRYTNICSLIDDLYLGLTKIQCDEQIEKATIDVNNIYKGKLQRIKKLVKDELHPEKDDE